MSAGAKTKLTLLELHRRMGHIAPDAVRKLVEDKRVVGVELEDDGEEMGTCKSEIGGMEFVMGQQLQRQKGWN